VPRRRELDHVDWLVRYQVRGESYTTIADSLLLKMAARGRTVRKAVRGLASYLRLTLRKQ
jgi:hypothetical protein